MSRDWWLMVHGLVRQRHPHWWQTIRLAQARPPIPDQHWHGHPSRRRQTPSQLMSAFLLHRSLGLVPVVLEPDLHLCRRQSDQAGQVFSLRCGQVALLPEASLQLVGLRFGEQDPSFTLLVYQTGVAVRRMVFVVVVEVVVVVVLMVVVLVIIVVVARVDGGRGGGSAHVGEFGSARCAVRTGLLAQSACNKRRYSLIKL